MSDFGRRTWDKSQYVGQGNAGTEWNLSEDALQQLKWKYTHPHELLSHEVSQLNKRVLGAGAGAGTTGKRGKQFGFYCELCDVTVKDSLQFADHLNHPAHRVMFETVLGEPLILEQRDNDDIPIDEFAEQYGELVGKFVRAHSTTVPAARRDNRAKRPKKNSIDMPSSEVGNVMGFASFGAK
ncbi:U4/U6-U5 snRNP complex subunit SNU23 KNAG_0A05700 [Huiozyma naganishii CBS 8797]|uniref:C2H2-type domain-containing protein n=1 Tax=Huiozyma naganishii (strain ATCC MYA-139 / BCRC 22969 / CBS 8797 / KCTC 17520 / NBRC 10181 / NCYC 3082 / Yp74L-3) TaxID=1071383 RepID=J7S2L1_HUIN7|nr:hypothetical protein KNAG_0A05700 [Kazachstania naganishii CBS 8797]CCK68234.1 hypothetical protein KNAG_0A05700 [Kazachstania naganishii CBS 8797]